MALLHVQFFSDVLARAASVDVILPEESKNLIGMETTASATYRTLYLLHGLSDDQTIWQRRTSVERYVAGRNMAVVMPNAERSWYCDEVHGGAYMTYIGEELPRVMRGFFRGMSDRREDNFIAGLSMGGYGALKIGLWHPERFRAIACFSGAINILRRAARVSGIERREWENIFGGLDAMPETFPGSLNDVEAQARRAAASGLPLPAIYMWCGTEDGLLTDAREARAYLSDLGFSLDYHESPGTHAWEYWDEQIQKALRFFDTLA